MLDVRESAGFIALDVYIGSVCRRRVRRSFEVLSRSADRAPNCGARCAVEAKALRLEGAVVENVRKEIRSGKYAPGFRIVRRRHVPDEGSVGALDLHHMGARA